MLLLSPPSHCPGSIQQYISVSTNASHLACIISTSLYTTVPPPFQDQEEEKDARAVLLNPRASVKMLRKCWRADVNFLLCQCSFNDLETPRVQPCYFSTYPGLSGRCCSWKRRPQERYYNSTKWVSDRVGLSCGLRPGAFCLSSGEGPTARMRATFVAVRTVACSGEQSDGAARDVSERISCGKPESYMRGVIC